MRVDELTEPAAPPAAAGQPSMSTPVVTFAAAALATSGASVRLVVDQRVDLAAGMAVVSLALVAALLAATRRELHATLVLGGAAIVAAAPYVGEARWSLLCVAASAIATTLACTGRPLIPRFPVRRPDLVRASLVLIAAAQVEWFRLQAIPAAGLLLAAVAWSEALRLRPRRAAAQPAPDPEGDSSR